MKRMALIFAIFFAGLTGALAQNVTVIGPITPGDCPQFSSTTVIKDGGFNCNGSPAVSFANPTGAVGLTGVNGAATTAMRSDAAPQLSSAVQSALTGTNTGLLLGTGAFGFGATAAPSTAGTLVYWSGSSWTLLSGNTGTTNCLQETSAGVPSFGLCASGAAGGVLSGTYPNPGFSTAVNTALTGTNNGLLFGTGVFGFSSTAAPSTAGTLNYWNGTTWTLLAGNTSGTACLQENASGVPSFGSCAFTSVLTIAALKAQTVPANNTAIYVQGYTTSGDGGEGWFVYNSSSASADNGGTIIAPTVGSGRYLRSINATNGQQINVKWFGVKGDGVTNDTAAVSNATAVAIAAEGALYFPSTSSCYLTSVTIPNGTVGLRIIGDAKGTSAGASGSGSVICSNFVGNTIDSTSSNGTIGNITIEHLKIYNIGTGSAISMTNNNWITLNDTVLFSVGGTTLNLSGVGMFHLFNNEIYGSSGAAVSINASALTNSGPGNVIGGQISNQGGTATGCLVVSGEPIGVVFSGVFFACQGANMAAAVTIDGDGVTATQIGAVTFIGCHGESDYNTSNNGSDFLIGATHKFGAVAIKGWMGIGGGNGTNFQQYGVRVTAAQSVSVKDSTFTKGGAASGYSGAAIRLDSTFPVAGNGDNYTFQNNTAISITGSLYSDANSVLGANAYSASFPAINQTGTKTNDNACTGCIGEYLVSDVPSGSAVSLTSGTAKTITSITLTPGDWDVSGMVAFPMNGTTNITLLIGSVSLTTNSSDTTNGRFFEFAPAAYVPTSGSLPSGVIKSQRFSVSSNTTVFLTANSLFTVSTLTAFGNISARRVR
jgi:hypothetical protein